MNFLSKLILMLGLAPVLTLLAGGLLGTTTCTGVTFDSCKLNSFYMGDIVYKLLLTGWVALITVPIIVVYFVVQNTKKHS